MADILPFPTAGEDEEEVDCTLENLTDAYLRVARAIYEEDARVYIPTEEEQPLVAVDADGEGAWVEAWVRVGANKRQPNKIVAE